MKRFFGRKDGDNILICDDEYNHLKNVLRIKVGDEVIVSLNTSKEYVCEVISLGKNAVCKINGENECLVNPKKDITLFQAVCKRPKFEFIVQKATEIGMSKIVPFMSEYCIAKVTENKMERLNSIVENACKQCERTIKPEISEASDVKGIIEMFKDYVIESEDDIPQKYREEIEKRLSSGENTEQTEASIIISGKRGKVILEENKMFY